MGAEGLRWPTVEQRRGPQGELFDADQLAGHHVGTGEWAGYEFLHVNARSIISTVPAASRMPFRHTVNVYRGCSHACSYCLAGDTPVLMADGRSRPIADLVAGDAIAGTEGSGAHRRYVPTAVLDQWQTDREAWEVLLAGGTRLVASGDHRFLTTAGWAHVAGTDGGAWQRPHLGSGDELVGPGGPCAGPAPGATGSTGGAPADLRVVAVRPLGRRMPMYDITTGTGDFVAGGVISHNCFARPTHEYLGLGIGEDFERRIVVKVNAVERLRAELAARRWAGHHIAMGTNTDPYQRCEGRYRLTRGVIEALAERANPFSILTKSTLLLRDLDVLAAAAARAEVRVNLSIGTLDEAVWRAAEPGTPAPRLRVEAVRRLNEAGIRCGVLIAPVLPGLSDRPEQLAEVVEAVVGAGAASVSSVALHLRGPLRQHYLSWLRGFDPDLADATERRYRGAHLPGPDQKALSALVGGMVERARRSAPGAAPGAQWVEGRFAERVRAQMGGDARPTRAAAPAVAGTGPAGVPEQLPIGWGLP